MIKSEYKNLSDADKRFLYQKGVHFCLSNSALTLELLPDNDASFEELSRLALSINGYETPRPEEDPEAELTLLRRRLFFSRRAMKWGYATERDFMSTARELIESIRAYLHKRQQQPRSKEADS